MIRWSKYGEDKLEGKAEIFLHWKNLVKVVLVMVWPLILALFFRSWILKVVCWGVFILTNIVCLPIWGPFVTAIAVTILPWYVLFEWKPSRDWLADLLALIAIIVTVIEISYIRHRMRQIEQIRRKENLPF